MVADERPLEFKREWRIQFSKGVFIIADIFVPPIESFLKTKIRFLSSQGEALQFALGSGYSLLDDLRRILLEHEPALILQVKTHLVLLEHVPVLLELPLNKFDERG